MDRSVLLDRLELTDLLARLSRAIDRSDRDGVAACYTEDSWDDHGGGFQGTGAQFADYICGGSPTSRDSRFLLHCLGQQLFDIDGDEAFGETAYLMDLENGEGELVHSCGRYVDYFRRVEGRWLIHYRQVVTDWTGVVSTQPFPISPTQIRSARDRSDRVYQRRRGPTEA
ncbi:MAG: nuclear transport factor 2 family protein [Sciscionella sp.]